jgi:hypothetical protein
MEEEGVYVYKEIKAGLNYVKKKKKPGLNGVIKLNMWGHYAS